MKKEKEVVNDEDLKYNQLRIELGALATGMFYNAQEERIKAFNRIRQIMFRKLEGIDLTAKQDKKNEEEKYQENYTDAKLLKYINANKGKLNEEEEGYIDKLMELLVSARQKENEFKKLMEFYIEQEPIYKWSKTIKGIGVLNTANLLQYFGYCEKAKHCSSLWKYAGLHVIEGKAPKLSKEQGQLDWNPKLRMLMYRVGDCFIKQRTPKYREIYDVTKGKELKRGGWDEKKKKMLKKEEDGAPQSLGHADNRARRKMIKEFLKDYYSQCLMVRGIEAEPPYSARFHEGE